MHGLVRSNKVVAQNGDRCHCKICIWTRSRTALVGILAPWNFKLVNSWAAGKYPDIVSLDLKRYVSQLFHCNIQCYPANTRSGYRTWAPCTHRFKFETFTGDFFHRKARFVRKLAIVHPDVKNGHEKSAVFLALGSNQEDLYKPTMSTSMQLKQITLPLVGECLNVSPHLAASQNSSKRNKRDPLGQQHPSQNHILSSPNMHDLEWESAILVSFSPFYIEKVPIWGLNLRSKTYGYIHPAKSPHLYQSMQRPPGRCI